MRKSGDSTPPLKFISTVRARTTRARGGDIDLLVISETLGFRDGLRLRTRILDRIGWQQLDLLVRRRNQLTDPLAALAQATGTKL